MDITSHNVLKLYNALLDYFGPQYWWPAKTEFEMLIGAILTQNTQWKNVEQALINLAPYLTPDDILKLSLSDLAALIKPCGYYNQKAKCVLTFTQWFNESFGTIDRAKQFEASRLRNALLGLKGIGPETADAMLVYAFQKPVFVIDAYTRRLFIRLGYRVPASYDAFQLQLETALGKHLSVEMCNEFHALIVAEAKEFCKVKPNCRHCPLNSECLYFHQHFESL